MRTKEVMFGLVLVCLVVASSGVFAQQQNMCHFISFEEFPAGTVFDNDTIHGLRISAVAAAPGFDFAVVFNTSNPTAGDVDLGTPNEAFGGPGIGFGPNAGLGNNVSLGNVLVISETDVDANNDGLIDEPDDNVNGGLLIFDFDGMIQLENIKLLDIENPGSSILFYNSSGGLVHEMPVAGLGDNSVQTLVPGISLEEVTRVVVDFATSGGALGDFEYCEMEECEDEDDDGVCDPDDMCPDSEANQLIDENGCDPFQFCNVLSCGPNCLKADFLGNEPDKEFPGDCTVVILENEGTFYPSCTPTEESNLCLG